MSKAKYKTGKRICSISEFELCESNFYKWNGKTTHKSFLISLQYITLRNAIITGRLFVAIPIKEGD